MLNDNNQSALIIEDDDSQARIIATLLTRMGYLPEICKDGRIARDRIAEHLEKTSIFIVDLHLPYINGLELLDDIASQPFYNQSKRLVTTADPVMGQEAEDTKGVKVLIKPIEFSEFEEFLNAEQPNY